MHFFRPTKSANDTRNRTHKIVGAKEPWRTSPDVNIAINRLNEQIMKVRGDSERNEGVRESAELAAPQGFEPRYADPESAVLPLNEGAVIRTRRAFSPCRTDHVQDRTPFL